MNTRESNATPPKRASEWSKQPAGLATRLMIACLSVGWVAAHAQAPDLLSGPELILQTGNSETEVMAFSKDGRYLATAGKDRNILLWDVRTGQVLNRLEGSLDAVANFDFRESEDLLAIGGSFRVLGLPTNKASIIWNYRTNEKLVLKEATDRIEFVSDETVISAGADRVLKLWNIKTGRPVASLGSMEGIADFTLGPEADAYLCRHNDSVVEVRSLRDGSVRRVLGKCGTFALSPDHQLLAWTPAAGTIQVIDARQGAERHVVKTGASRLAFSADGRWVVAVDYQANQFTTFELAAAYPRIKRLSIPAPPNYGPFAVGPNGALATLVDGAVSIYRHPTGEAIRSLNRGTANGGAVAVSHDGKSFAVGQADGTVVIWSALLGRPTRSFSAVSTLDKYAHVPVAINSLAFSPQGGYLASTAASIWNTLMATVPPVTISDQVSGQPTGTIEPNSWGVYYLARAYQQNWVAIAAGNTANIHAFPGGELVRSLDNQAKQVLSAAFSPDGRWLATGGGSGGKVVVWDLVANWQSQVVWNDPSELIQSLAFSPDSRLLAIGGTTKVILADPARKTVLFESDGHTGWVQAVAFSADGRRLISGSEDQTIKVWDVRSGALVRTLRGHTGAVRALAYLSGQFASWADDGTIRIWNLETGELIATIFSFGDASQWLVATPEGLFDGTATAMAQVGWRQPNLGVAPVDQFYNDFFYPGLLAEILEGRRPKPEIDVATIVQVPGLRTMLAKKQARIMARGRELVVCFKENPNVSTQSPIGAREIPKDEDNGFRIMPNDGECKYQLVLPNSGGNGAELQRRLETWRNPAVTTPWDKVVAPIRTSTLHVLCIGVGQYREAMNFPQLPYAVPSGNAIETFFSGQAIGGRNRAFAAIRVWPGLYDAAATRQSIQTRLSELAAATKADDVVILYLAGHGSVQGSQEMFYFAPFDARGDALRESELGTPALADLMRNIRARRIVLLIDACQSGGAVEALSRVGEARVRAYEREAELTPAVSGGAVPGVGIHVIAATTPLSYAANPSVDRSFLANAFLKFLHQPRDGGTARGMVAFLEQTVPLESEKAFANFRQVPLAASIGLDFAVGARVDSP